MPLFISDEEFSAAVDAKADAFIHGLLDLLNIFRAKADAAEEKYVGLLHELDTVRAKADAAEEKYLGLLHELDTVRAKADSAEKNCSLIEQCLHEKDREIKSLNLELSEKNTSLHKITVHLTNNYACKEALEAKVAQYQTKVAQYQTACARLVQAKALFEELDDVIDASCTEAAVASCIKALFRRFDQVIDTVAADIKADNAKKDLEVFDEDHEDELTILEPASASVDNEQAEVISATARHVGSPPRYPRGQRGRGRPFRRRRA